LSGAIRQFPIIIISSPFIAKTAVVLNSQHQLSLFVSKWR
jgi:hypothetical protein